MSGEPPLKTPKTIRGHCPNCGPARFADVVSSYTDTEDLEPALGIWAQTTSKILQCGGCRSVYFQEVYIFSEEYERDENGDISYSEHITFYPSPAKRKRPEWLSYINLENHLYDLLDETYKTLNVDARVLAATGARTVFDRASELLKIDPALSFKEKLEVLHERGHIGKSEMEHLSVITDAGGAAAHRGWKPSLRQLDTVMSIVEAFIHRAFIIDAEAKKLKAQIPKRKPRKK